MLLVVATLFATQSFKNQPQDKYLGPPVFLYKHGKAKLMDNNALQVNAQKWAGISSDAKAQKVGAVSMIAPKDDPSASFEQDEQGSIRFSRSLKKYDGDFQPKLAPVDNADKIAIKFLKENNLLPANESELKVAHIGGLRAAKAESNQVIDKMRTVHFSREIDGLPVLGPGSKIIVHLGDKNQVEGLIHRWKELESSGEAKVSLNPAQLRGEKEARDEITTRIKKDWGKAAQFKFNNVKMAYYDSNDGYVQPVYVFETTITPDNSLTPAGQRKQSERYLGMVPVMKNAPENVISETAPPRTVKTEMPDENKASSPKNPEKE